MSQKQLSQSKQQSKSDTSLPLSILQHTAVRQVTEQVIQPQTQIQPSEQKNSRFQHDFSQIPLFQASMKIGAVGDKYEQEADRLAADVVQHINAPENPLMQREQMLEDEDKLQMKPMVQRFSSQGDTSAIPDLEASIEQARSSGQPLTENIRKPMEQAFGTNFSGVKVHTDAQSDLLNKSIQAKAFTTKQDVFFRQGAYDPKSRGGQELIAHELTHVVQQNGIQRFAQPTKQSNYLAPKVQLSFNAGSKMPTIQRNGDDKNPAQTQFLNYYTPIFRMLLQKVSNRQPLDRVELDLIHELKEQALELGLPSLANECIKLYNEARKLGTTAAPEEQVKAPPPSEPEESEEEGPSLQELQQNYQKWFQEAAKKTQKTELFTEKLPLDSSDVEQESRSKRKLIEQEKRHLLTTRAQLEGVSFNEFKQQYAQITNEYQKIFKLMKYTLNHPVADLLPAEETEESQQVLVEIKSMMTYYTSGNFVSQEEWRTWIEKGYRAINRIQRTINEIQENQKSANIDYSKYEEQKKTGKDSKKEKEEKSAEPEVTVEGVFPAGWKTEDLVDWAWAEFPKKSSTKISNVMRAVNKILSGDVTASSDKFAGQTVYHVSGGKKGSASSCSIHFIYLPTGGIQVLGVGEHDASRGMSGDYIFVWTNPGFYGVGKTYRL